MIDGTGAATEAATVTYSFCNTLPLGQAASAAEPQQLVELEAQAVSHDCHMKKPLPI